MVVGTLPNVVVLVLAVSAVSAASAASFNFILTDKLPIPDPVPPEIECVSTKPALESLLSSAVSRSQSYIKKIWFPNVFDMPCRYPVGPPLRSHPEKTKDVFAAAAAAAAAAAVAGEEELGVVVAVAMGDDDEEDRKWRCYASGTHLPSNDPS
jgi:hypothetical protein